MFVPKRAEDNARHSLNTSAFCLFLDAFLRSGFPKIRCASSLFASHSRNSGVKASASADICLLIVQLWTSFLLDLYPFCRFRQSRGACLYNSSAPVVTNVRQFDERRLWKILMTWRPEFATISEQPFRYLALMYVLVAHHFCKLPRGENHMLGTPEVAMLRTHAHTANEYYLYDLVDRRSILNALSAWRIASK